MQYLTHYHEYPIWEPAEGGYYYAGNDIVTIEKKSKRQCKKEFEEIWQQCLLENKENGFVEGADWERVREENGSDIYPWIRNGNLIYRDSYYIGDGESFMIERHYGSAVSGYQPYC